MFSLFKSQKRRNKLNTNGNIPKVFVNAYSFGDDENLTDNLDEIIKKFNQDFELEKFVLPKGFREFIANKKQWGFPSDEVPEFETMPYEEILSVAYDLIMGCDVFMLPPFCIPFGGGDCGHTLYSLDYSNCGIAGEPQVILTDDEWIDYEDNEDVSTYNFNKVYAAKNFEQFLKIVKER